jgi:hypothetical protein
LGNLALGCKAALLRFREIFLSINPFLFKILPTVLSDTISPSLFIIAANLCFDQAGYCFRSSTALATIGQGAAGLLAFFGLREYSFKPITPRWLNLFNHL